MSAEVLRGLLDQFSTGELKLGELCQKAPSCASEGAATPADCIGPVKDNEILRFFLCSPSEQKWPTEVKALKTKVQSRAVKPTSFRRAFKSGLSVVRAKHASPEEMELAAQIQFDNMKREDTYSGGIYAIFEFEAGDVRTAYGGEGMCVYETPLDQLDSGAYARPSHSDVAARQLPLDDIERSRLERELYEHLMKSGRAKCIPTEDIDGGSLTKFLPAAVVGVLAGPAV